jgi:hypothetical protein
MRAKLLLLIVVASSTVAFAQTPGPRSLAGALPPISWTCPMHPDVVDDRKGTCPICKMDLAAIRIVSVWTCPVHGVIEETRPGQCRICKRDLVQAARSLSFTCTGHPEINQTDPGRCADGSPMIAKYSPRPHGDHNPRHGGIFFMAPDNWHHIEGAYPAEGRFRVYLYDDYTRPLPLAEAKKIRARVVLKETFDPATKTTRELSAVPLVLAPGGAFLQARIDPLALPAAMTAKIAFDADDKESRFDFNFPAYSKDAAPAGAPSSSASPAAAPTPAASGTNPRPPADAGPIAALVRDLKARDAEVALLVKSGNFGAIYVPALQAKDLALQIQSRQSQGATPDRQAIEAHVKQIVVAAYQLDNYGDLGDAEKIGVAYRDFSLAIGALDSLMVVRP